MQMTLFLSLSKSERKSYRKKEKKTSDIFDVMVLSTKPCLIIK